MSTHSPVPREDLRPASAEQIGSMEALAYKLLGPQPVEASRSCGLMSELGNQAMIEVAWDESPDSAAEADTTTLVISDAEQQQILACAFNSQNEAILTAYRDDTEGHILTVLDDLLAVEFDVEEIREILRFFQLMMFTVIGLESQEALRTVGGMDGDEQHIADKMRSFVMAKSEVVRRTRAYQLPLGDEQQSVVEVFENRLSGLDLAEVVKIPSLSVELVRRSQDIGWRFARYPDDDCMLEQFTPTLEAEEDDGDWDEETGEVDDDVLEALEGELTDSMYVPQVGDVRRLTDALRQCGVFEVAAETSTD